MYLTDTIFLQTHVTFCEYLVFHEFKHNLYTTTTAVTLVAHDRFPTAWSTWHCCDPTVKSSWNCSWNAGWWSTPTWTTSDCTICLRTPPTRTSLSLCVWRVFLGRRWWVMIVKIKVLYNVQNFVDYFKFMHVRAHTHTYKGTTTS